MKYYWWHLCGTLQTEQLKSSLVIRVTKWIRSDISVTTGFKGRLAIGPIYSGFIPISNPSLDWPEKSMKYPNFRNIPSSWWNPISLATNRWFFKYSVSEGKLKKHGKKIIKVLLFTELSFNPFVSLWSLSRFFYNSAYNSTSPSICFQMFYWSGWMRIADRFSYQTRFSIFHNKTLGLLIANHETVSEQKALPNILWCNSAANVVENIV